MKLLNRNPVFVPYYLHFDNDTVKLVCEKLTTSFVIKYL
jgi:hypothetical protein